MEKSGQIQLVRSRASILGQPPRDRQSQELTNEQKRGLVEELGFYVGKYTEKDRTIAEAYRSSVYSMRARSDVFGVSRMTEVERQGRTVKGSKLKKRCISTEYPRVNV